eukprot:7927616-Alexandrium_andersonii.AAC.1
MCGCTCLELNGHLLFATGADQCACDHTNANVAERACAGTSANIAQQWLVSLLAGSRQAYGKPGVVACPAAACQLLAQDTAFL